MAKLTLMYITKNLCLTRSDKSFIMELGCTSQLIKKLKRDITEAKQVLELIDLELDDIAGRMVDWTFSGNVIKLAAGSHTIARLFNLQMRAKKQLAMKKQELHKAQAYNLELWNKLHASILPLLKYGVKKVRNSELKDVGDIKGLPKIPKDAPKTRYRIEAKNIEVVLNRAQVFGTLRQLTDLLKKNPKLTKVVVKY